MSRTLGIAGQYMTAFAPPGTGACAGGSGDMALSSGSDASASSWVLYPPLTFVSCTQVGARMRCGVWLVSLPYVAFVAPLFVPPQTPTMSSSQTASQSSSRTASGTPSQAATPSITASLSGTPTQLQTRTASQTRVPTITSTQVRWSFLRSLGLLATLSSSPQSVYASGLRRLLARVRINL